MKANFYNKKKIKYLNMLASGKPKRNSRGTIVKAATFQSKDAPLAHVESKRSLFNHSKVVTQNELDEYRSSVVVKNPYDVLISTGNVPYSIINNDVKTKRRHDLSNCFGTKGASKKPRLPYSSLEEMKKKGEEVRQPKAEPRKNDLVKGQGQRIWNELYKVLDSSDVIVHVLDARDPIGTKCKQIEEYVAKEGKHKHLMYVLNKVDLVPTSITAQWLRVLSKEHPAVAFHANSIDHNYGKNNLINLLRQLKTLYNKQNISVGFVGYPNCGKSSIINALKEKKVCKTAPIPGETRFWQYIALTREIYLIDSPGVVPISDFRMAVLKGAIRIEKVENPDTYIEEVVEKVGKKAIEQTYGVAYENIEDFFMQMGVRFKRLLKGGEPDVDLIAKQILHDWHRGKIPYYVPPEGIMT